MFFKRKTPHSHLGKNTFRWHRFHSLPQIYTVIKLVCDVMLFLLYIYCFARTVSWATESQHISILTKMCSVALCRHSFKVARSPQECKSVPGIDEHLMFFKLDEFQHGSLIIIHNFKLKQFVLRYFCKCMKTFALSEGGFYPTCGAKCPPSNNMKTLDTFHNLYFKSLSLKPRIIF